MTDLIKYKLKTPVNLVNGAVLSEVTLREPTVDDMIAMDDVGGGENTQVARLLSLMAGIDFNTLRKIASRDAMAMKRLADAKWGNEEEDGDNSPS